jgi:hypothetical protein
MKIVYDYAEMKVMIKDNLKSKGILPKGADVEFNVAYRKKDGVPSHVVSVYIVDAPVKEDEPKDPTDLFNEDMS